MHEWLRKLQSFQFVNLVSIPKANGNPQQGIELMMKNTGMARKEAEDEVDRYCVLPGQACAYKVTSITGLLLKCSKLLLLF